MYIASSFPRLRVAHPFGFCRVDVARMRHKHGALSGTTGGHISGLETLADLADKKMECMHTCTFVDLSLILV